MSLPACSIFSPKSRARASRFAGFSVSTNFPIGPCGGVRRFSLRRLNGSRPVGHRHGLCGDHRRLIRRLLIGRRRLVWRLLIRRLRVLLLIVRLPVLRVGLLIVRLGLWRRQHRLPQLLHGRHRGNDRRMRRRCDDRRRDCDDDRRANRRSGRADHGRGFACGNTAVLSARFALLGTRRSGPHGRGCRLRELDRLILPALLLRLFLPKTRRRGDVVVDRDCLGRSKGLGHGFARVLGAILMQCGEARLLQMAGEGAVVGGDQPGGDQGRNDRGNDLAAGFGHQGHELRGSSKHQVTPVRGIGISRM